MDMEDPKLALYIAGQYLMKTRKASQAAVDNLEIARWWGQGDYWECLVIGKYNAEYLAISCYGGRVHMEVYYNVRNYTMRNVNEVIADCSELYLDRRNTMRQFEWVTGFGGDDLPERKTKASAGYDLEAYYDGEIKPGDTVMVATGIKCRMNENEHLQLHLRSSVGIKNPVMLACGVGIIDADYYNNEDNEGHIYIPIRNFGNKTFKYKKGDRLAQGIFVPFNKTDDDNATGERTGGYGSTSNGGKWYKKFTDEV